MPASPKAPTMSRQQAPPRSYSLATGIAAKLSQPINSSLPDLPRIMSSGIDTNLLTPVSSAHSSSTTPAFGPFSESEASFYTSASSVESSCESSDGLASPWPRRLSGPGGKIAGPAPSVLPVVVRPDSLTSSTDEEMPTRSAWTTSPVRRHSSKRYGWSKQPTEAYPLPVSPNANASRYSVASCPTPNSHPSGPSIRVCESSRGAPRLSFVRDGMESPPQKTLEFGAKMTNSPTSKESPSSGEPSPTGARKRRLNALRGLVANLDFAQPWSIVDQPHHDETGKYFWACPGDPPPQLELSLGTKFDGKFEVDEPTPTSPDLGSPVESDTDSQSWGHSKSKSFSRSLISVVHDDDDDNRERSISPPFPMVDRPASTTPRAAPKKAWPADKCLQYPPLTAQNIGTGSLDFSPPQRQESFHVRHTGYTKSTRPVMPRVETGRTWREALNDSDIYQNIVSQEDGEKEVKRQEVMFEFCETEHAFVRSCRDVLRLFAHPLKTPDGVWMSGIPTHACELFDLLEKLTDTHDELARALQGLPRTNGTVQVGQFVTAMRPWIEKLSCHEPYIASFHPVSQFLDEETRNEMSNYGEFLRMQTRNPAMGAMGLTSMLLKPIQRLTKYPLMLHRLLDATPVGHPDHAAVSELIEATETVLSHLETCKAREDEFQQLVSIQQRCDGLPLDFRLATRGRRLLGHAQVVRAYAKDAVVHPGAHFTRSHTLKNIRSSLQSALGAASTTDLAAYAGFTSSDASEVKERPSRRSTRDSTTTTSSATSATSSTQSLASSLPRRPPVSRGASLISSDGTPPPSKSPSIRKARRDDVYTMLIFNDVILIAQPMADRGNLFRTKKSDLARLRLVPVAEGGLGSVDDMKMLVGNGTAEQFALTVRGHHGPVNTTTYALVPPTSSLSRRTQRSAAIGSDGIATVDDLVETIGSMTR
ncbi:hypothetical protein A1Q1_08202 [Trichosporon asahii var. asahii CBS 2479]|uniref:DH domain-containing protein n=1 Tax=Trichosporon asahii var. asahii (strain ATCC 90039 / CBS 2479 / JCM 2466 / KCTC 7840 / NBRC 103889/ NCYC 2677 / UAMH 7654) TaxID=1186058 RepID=J4UGP4_TRIAS|nr:hypothetical protein A1Q1_08202 [Trichosporon asahii var. asahii CBS 2479]EJT50650.1 hypothetical protein A1Q1_08202 [Trichosporon asahii var. asahii CBS 2479]